MSKLKYFDGTNWKIVNGQVTGDTLPIGSQIPYGSTIPPVNWLVCDGSAVSRTTYAELFAVIGTSYGAGDGSTTFNLPNKKGRKSVGYDSNDTDFNAIGKKGGEKTHTLTINEMPSHTHTGKANVLGGFAGYPVANVDVSGDAWNYSSDIVQNTGGDQAHNIEDPFEVDCWIIKAKQSAGVVANVSNTQSDSTKDTYSCDYINGIIESGSNANGTYTKFADGTLICKNYFGPITTNGGSGLNTTVNLPTSFLNNEYTIVATILDGQAYWADISYSAGSKATNSFVFSTWNNGGEANLNQWFNYIAIGRWK